jgi:flagellar biogenesis protein FliO
LSELTDMIVLMDKESPNQQGFITMIVMMLIILGVVIFLAYKRVAGS